MDSLNMQKGDVVALTGAKTALLTEAKVGLGWDTNAGQSQFDLDLDAAIIGRDTAGKMQAAVYFNNLKEGDWAEHSGDNLTGAGEGDDEVITLNLNMVPANIAALDVYVHIYQGQERNQNFLMVDNCFARVFTPAGVEMIHYDVTNEMAFAGQTGLWVARFKRVGPTWAFEAMGRAEPEDADLISSSKVLRPA